MSDNKRELPELAVKAAGISKQRGGSFVDKTHTERVWNPLIDGNDHANAVARLSELMDMDITAGSAEDAEFELLVLLIQSYEQTKFPPAPPWAAGTTVRTTKIGRKMV